MTLKIWETALFDLIDKRKILFWSLRPFLFRWNILESTRPGVAAGRELAPPANGSPDRTPELRGGRLGKHSALWIAKYGPRDSPLIEGHLSTGLHLYPRGRTWRRKHPTPSTTARTESDGSSPSFYYYTRPTHHPRAGRGRGLRATRSCPPYYLSISAWNIFISSLSSAAALC